MSCFLRTPLLPQNIVAFNVVAFGDEKKRHTTLKQGEREWAEINIEIHL